MEYLYKTKSMAHDICATSNLYEKSKIRINIVIVVAYVKFYDLH
jgi:hypothetical protein